MLIAVECSVRFSRLLTCLLLGLLVSPALAGPAPFVMTPMPVSQAGRTGFVLMGAETTGIRFTNGIDDRLIMNNNNFMEGSGVALGDFDGDGWCDIFFCAIDGTNALYRNLGDWKFEDVTARAGVGLGGPGWHSTGAVFADINGDDQLDLIVNTLGKGTHCFVNQGQGKFKDTTREAGVGAKTGSLSLALADIDGDGDLDLYVVNYGTLAILRAGGRADMIQVNGQWQLTGPHADRLRMVDGRLEEVGEPDVLYRNDGRGHFEAIPWNSEWFLDEQGAPLETPWDFGLSAHMRDINGDGSPDIYVCNDFQTVDRLWLNDGTGRFRLISKLATRHQSFASMGVDFADFDRDGYLDFFVVEMMSRDHSRRMRQIGGLRPVVPMPGRFDNRPEIARNTLYRNRGDGTYAEIADFAGVHASEWSWQPVFIDMDLDGYEDILVSNGNAFDVQDRDTLDRVKAIGRQTPEQTRTNILLYPRLLTSNMAFHNQGDLTFRESGKDWGFDAPVVSHGIALADLDHDGDLDAVINGLYIAPLLYRNLSSEPRVAVRLRGNAPNVQGIGAKITLLGGPVPSQSQEIVSGGRYLSGDDTIRVFAAGRTNRNLRLEVTWRNGRHSSVDHVRPNALYEVRESGSDPAPSVPGMNSQAMTLFTDVSDQLGHSHHEEIFDDYSRQPLLMKQFSALGPGVAWFDLNGDGHDDLFVGAGKGGWLAAYQGDGQGEFKPWPPSPTVPLIDDLTGLAGWVEGNGQRRLLAGLARYETAVDPIAAAGVWRVDPVSGAFQGAPLGDIGPFNASSGPIAVADFDADGQLDVFVGGRVIPGQYPRRASSRLYRQRQGRLVLDPDHEALMQDIGLVSGAVWTDLNGDGYPELVLACEWGPVRVMHNDRGRLRDATDEWGLAGLTGWWNSVTAADLNGDGRLDLIAGNWGLNSPDQPTAQHPVKFYYGDLGQRGVMDLVEAYYDPELKSVVPRRSMGALAQAAPLLSHLFPSYESFGTASVEDIFVRLQVQPARVEAVTLASTVFLNRGKTFQAVPLPAEAQWAPVFAVNAADVDGDGIEDLFLSQNFFAMRLELPRLDAGRGLWLRGLGDGRMVTMSGQESGVIVHGEQRGAALADFNEDGRVDLVVTQNGAETKLFQNVGGQPGLRVRLRGPVGNPDGFGAVLRPVYGDRVGPAREVRSGAGYWSQDGAVQVLGGRERPGKIRVRWPGGKQSEVAVESGAKEVIIDFAR